MKRVGLAVMALIMMVGLTMAQGPRGGQRGMDAKQRAEKMTEHMVKEYGLNDTQKQQLLEVNLAMAEKMGNRPARGPRMHHGKKHQPCDCPCEGKEKGKEAKGEQVAEGEKEKNVARTDRPERRQRADRKERPQHKDRGERPQLSKEDMEKHRQEMKENRDSYHAELQKIMDQEQYQAYSKKQAEREQQMKERMQKAREARKMQKEG